MQIHASDPSLHLLRGHQPQPGGQVHVSLGGDSSSLSGDEPKFHARHAPPPSLRQALKDKLWQFAGTQTVPVHVTILLCLVCVWAGSSMHLGEDLPVPSTSGPTILDKGAQSGGMHPVSGSSRSLLLLAEEAKTMEQQHSTTNSGHVKHSGAPTTQELQDILQHFEPNALNTSGFLDVRPAFPKVGDSGEGGRMRAVPYQVVSWYPRIIYYPGFLTPAQTEHVVKLALARMAPSDLAYRPGESIPERQEVRTSTGCFMLPEEDKDGVLQEVADKIASVTHLPVENGEAFNVLRYLPTQHYDSHLDAFDEASYGRQSSHRIATFLTFLRAPEEGGETVFKREGENNANLTISDWRGCSDNLGIRVKPKVGDAVLFYSYGPDLQLDTRSLHGACPVVKGEKISMARWIHEKPVSGSHRMRRLNQAKKVA